MEFPDSVNWAAQKIWIDLVFFGMNMLQPKLSNWGAEIWPLIIWLPSYLVPFCDQHWWSSVVEELRQKHKCQKELLKEMDEVLDFWELQASCSLKDRTAALFFLFKLGVPQINDLSSTEV